MTRAELMRVYDALTKAEDQLSDAEHRLLMGGGDAWSVTTLKLDVQRLRAETLTAARAQPEEP